MTPGQFFERFEGFHWRERRLGEMLGCKFEEDDPDPGATLRALLSEEEKFDIFWAKVEADRKNNKVN